MNKRLKKVFKISGYTLASITLLIVLAIWLLSMERFQNLLAKRAARYLSAKLHTRVEVSHVKFTFFNKFDIDGVYIEDDKKDTLAYIGKIQVRTSELLGNYWNNRPPVIRNLKIQDVYVYLNRAKDTSRWNYNFIQEALSPTTAPVAVAPSVDTTTKKSDPILDLKDVSIENIRFYMDDAWRGEDMRFAFKKLELDVKKFDLAAKIIDIGKVKVGDADVFVKSYTGGKPKDLTPDDTSKWGTPFNPNNFGITLEQLSVSNSQFRYTAGDPKSKPNEFDEKNLGLTNINLELAKAHITADTLFAELEKLTADERCGLVLKSLTGKLKLSQVQAQLSSMKLVTKNAVLEDYFEMRYRNFHDFIKFIPRVKMIARFKNSTINSIDLAYFSNQLKRYPFTLNITGEAAGTVNDLDIKGLLLQTMKTYYDGDLAIKGLPDIRKTLFTADIRKLITSGHDLNILVPQTKADAIAWNEMKLLTFTGNFTGMIDNFHATGLLSSTLGNAKVDIDMDVSGRIPQYAGTVQTDDFYLGKLIRQNSIGHIGFNGKIKGQGFDFNTLTARMDATISKVEINNILYRDLTINGLVSNKKFDGIFVSKDPMLTFNFDGKMDLSGVEPLMNFNSRILRFDLQKMGWTNESVVVSCIANLNFRGGDIDAFLGSASLRNVVVQSQGKTVQIDTITLESRFENLEKIIQLKSSVADATLKGKFNISELSRSFQLYLSHYLPNYIKKPGIDINEQFNYAINIKNIDPLLQLFMPSVSGLNGSLISGNLNTYEKKFSLDTYIPDVGYEKVKVKEIYIVSAGDFSSFEMNVNSGNLLYNDDIIIPSFQINTSLANDTAMLEINTQSINDLLGNASIKVKGTAFNRNLYLNVLPSSVSIKKDIWNLSSRNEMVIGEQVTVKDLIIESGAQKIVLNTENNVSNNLVAILENIDLESVSEYAGISSPQYFGRISGSIRVNDFRKHPVVNVALNSTDEIRIDRDTLGMVSLFGNYDFDKKILVIDPATAVTRNSDKAFLSGKLDLHDSTVNLNASLNNTSISFINQFIDDYVDELKGKMTGDIKMNGKLDNPTITGALDVTGSSLKIILLGTTYKIPHAKFRFNNRKIEMDDVTIYDERNGDYSGIVKGTIMHNNFRDFYLNLTLNSDNLLCLNTREWEGDLFYGFVAAAVNASITGSLNDLLADVDARPLKGSTFHLPVNSTGDASKFEYVKFLEIGRSQYDPKNEKRISRYLKLTMNIDATPDIETFIILDSNTGEEIRARGNGALKLIVDLGNSMEMYGTYNITEGKYLFKFRGVINREFTIEEGSRISWTGDALAARMNVRAVYTLPKPLSLYPLVSAQFATLDESDQFEARRTYRTLVPLTLSGSLSQPDIKFDILQPDNKAVGTMAYTRLQQIKNDEKELVSQAGVLLLAGDFIASDGVAGATYKQGTVSTVSDLVGGAVSSEITNLFRNITDLKNVSLNVGYQSLANDANLSNSNRNQFSFSVSANLLKERVIVDFGNSVDFGKDNVTGNTTSNYNIGGDFKAQLLITKDGRLRANAYRTNNVDIGGSPFTRGGIGLSYKKVFNSFADLLSGGKNKRKAVITDTVSNI